MINWSIQARRGCEVANRRVHELPAGNLTSTPRFYISANAIADQDVENAPLSRIQSHPNSFSLLTLSSLPNSTGDIPRQQPKLVAVAGPGSYRCGESKRLKWDLQFPCKCREISGRRDMGKSEDREERIRVGCGYVENVVSRLGSVKPVR